MLEIKNLSVEVEKKSILKEINISVSEGEVLVLLGPNGAGKSTLLQVAAGLKKPTSGNIFFSGHPALNDLDYRRNVSTVFQSPLLLSDTVEHNIACGLRFRGMAKQEIEKRVNFWMEKLHISHLSKRQARSLSGGEAQRVSLARAFCLNTKLILMDEPFSALDTPTRNELIAELRRLFCETGQTCIYVTHDLEEALLLADRVAVIINGSIHQLDTTQGVFLHPSTSEVAQFVGMENIIPGKIVAKHEHLLQIQSAQSMIDAVGDFEIGSEVFFCLRPEDILLSPAAASDFSTSARNKINCTITRINLQRPFARVQIEAGFSLNVLLTYPSLEQMNLQVGDEVCAIIKSTAIHLIPNQNNSI